MSTDVLCGRCQSVYDADVQVPVCPHETIEKVERERKAKAESGLGIPADSKREAS